MTRYTEKNHNNGEVELEARYNELVIKPIGHPRQNWDEAFKAMAQSADDKLLEFAKNKWDVEEWA